MTAFIPFLSWPFDRAETLHIALIMGVILAMLLVKERRKSREI